VKNKTKKLVRKISVIIIALTMFFINIIAAQAATTTLNTTLDDTYTTNTDQNNNFGTEPAARFNFEADYVYYIKFNISSIGSVNIDNATLFLWQSNSQIDTGEWWTTYIYHLHNHTWDEEIINHNYYDNLTLNVDYYKYNYSNFTSGNTGAGDFLNQANITSYLQSEINNYNDTISFIVYGGSPDNGDHTGDEVTIHTKESASTTKRPYIKIDYSNETNPPNITNATISETSGSGPFTINVTVTDDLSGINNVQVQITNPSNSANHTMSLASGNLYTYTHTPSVGGNHTFHFYATDNALNTGNLSSNLTYYYAAPATGGGGGGGSIIQSCGLQLLRPLTISKIYCPTGERAKPTDIYIKNNGDLPLTINARTDLEGCTFTNNTLTLLGGQTKKTTVQNCECPIEGGVLAGEITLSASFSQCQQTIPYTIEEGGLAVLAIKVALGTALTIGIIIVGVLIVR
jgi:hypothetical protein